MRWSLPLLTSLLLIAMPLSLPFALGEGHETDKPACGTLSVDVLFVFDTTGSMGGVLSSAQSGASSVMANIRASVPDSWFGVAHYQDYPGFYNYPGYASTYGGTGDTPWRLLQPMDPNTAASDAAIGTLFASGGADGPESLTRAAYESFADPAVAWRAGSVRVVVVFTDAPAHDTNFASQNTGGDPGRDAIAFTADDLDFETTVANADANGIRFAGVGVGGGSGDAYLQYMASETGGAFTRLTSDFVGDITDLVLDVAGSPVALAHSDALLADVVTVASQNLDVAHVEAGPHSEHHDETFHTLLLGSPLDGHVKTGDGEATTFTSTSLLHASARSTIEDVSLLGGLVQARLLQSVANADLTAFGPFGHTTGTVEFEAVVNGVPVSVSAPNTNITIPGIGWVTLNEQIIQYGPQSVEVEVNMIHLHAEVAGQWVNVKVAHAWVGVACTDEFTHDDSPTPPRGPDVTPVIPACPLPDLLGICVEPVDPTNLCRISPILCIREICVNGLPCIRPV